MKTERPADFLSGRHHCHWQKTVLEARAEAARLRRKLQALGVDPATPGVHSPAARRPDPAAELARALRNLLDASPSSRREARAVLARYDDRPRRETP